MNQEANWHSNLLTSRHANKSFEQKHPHLRLREFQVILSMRGRQHLLECCGKNKFQAGLKTFASKNGFLFVRRITRFAERFKFRGGKAFFVKKSFYWIQFDNHKKCKQEYEQWN